MNRACIFVLFFFLCYSDSIAQNNVGVGTNTPDVNSILELQSGDKGLLIPRMTAIQRNSMSVSLGLAQKGLLVFDNDSTIFFFWNGYAWQTIDSGAMGPMGPMGPPANTIIHADFVDTTNNVNTVEQVLKSWIIPANTLLTDGSWIEVEVFGTITNQTDYPLFRIRVGGLVCFLMTPVNNGSGFVGQFYINSKIYRTSNTSQKIFTIGYGRANMTVLNTAATTFNLSTNLNVQFTAQDIVAGANHIVVKGFTMRKIE